MLNCSCFLGAVPLGHRFGPKYRSSDSVVDFWPFLASVLEVHCGTNGLLPQADGRMLPKPGTRIMLDSIVFASHVVSLGWGAVLSCLFG